MDYPSAALKGLPKCRRPGPSIKELVSQERIALSTLLWRPRHIQNSHFNMLFSSPEERLFKAFGSETKEDLFPHTQSNIQRCVSAQPSRGHLRQRCDAAEAHFATCIRVPSSQCANHPFVKVATMIMQSPQSIYVRDGKKERCAVL